MSFGLNSVLEATKILETFWASKWYAITGSLPLSKYISDLLANKFSNGPPLTNKILASVSLLDGLIGITLIAGVLKRYYHERYNKEVLQRFDRECIKGKEVDFDLLMELLKEFLPFFQRLRPKEYNNCKIGLITQVLNLVYIIGLCLFIVGSALK